MKAKGPIARLMPFHVVGINWVNPVTREDTGRTAMFAALTDVKDGGEVVEYSPRMFGPDSMYHNVTRVATAEDQAVEGFPHWRGAMTDVERLITSSRASMASGRVMMRQKRLSEAREHFRAALDARLEAISVDPERKDPGWLMDVQNVKGEPMRHPFEKSADTALRLHEAFLDYLRIQVGEMARPAPQPPPADPVRVPTIWVETSQGKPAKDASGKDVPCRHVWVLLSVVRRSCASCGAVDTLAERMPAGETKAHQRMVKERG